MTSIDLTTDAPPTTPAKHTGTMCGHMVSGGMMSYRCELIQGHGDKPPEDPEPHYAVEVQRSVRAWQDWARRQWEARREARGSIVVDEDLPVATARGAQGPIPEPFRCGLEGCDYPYPHSHGTDVSQEPEAVREIFPAPAPGERPEVLVANAEAIANGDLHNPYDEGCSKRGFGEVVLPNERCMICRPLTETEQDYIAEPLRDLPTTQVISDLLTLVSAEYPAPDPSLAEIAAWDDDTKRAVIEWASAVHLVASDNDDVEIPPLPSVLNAFDGVPPTRQRPEDQPLPDGDESIPDDQQVLIDFIAQRRQVGISRYGQGHRPFNGRDTLQDLFEEQVDLMVYFTSIMRSAAATREDLIAVVEQAMANLSQTRDPAGMTNAKVAEVAVERVMAWVAATILMAPEITFDRVYTAVLAEMENSPEGRTQGDFAVAVAKRVMEPQPPGDQP